MTRGFLSLEKLLALKHFEQNPATRLGAEQRAQDHECANLRSASISTLCGLCSNVSGPQCPRPEKGNNRPSPETQTRLSRRKPFQNPTLREFLSCGVSGHRIQWLLSKVPLISTLILAEGGSASEQNSLPSKPLLLPEQPTKGKKAVMQSLLCLCLCHRVPHAARRPFSWHGSRRAAANRPVTSPS